MLHLFTPCPPWISSHSTAFRCSPALAQQQVIRSLWGGHLLLQWSNWFPSSLLVRTLRDARISGARKKLSSISWVAAEKVVEFKTLKWELRSSEPSTNWRFSSLRCQKQTLQRSFVKNLCFLWEMGAVWYLDKWTQAGCQNYYREWKASYSGW